MKYITVIFWTLVLGEVLGYIGSALETATFNPELTAIWSVIVGTIGAWGKNYALLDSVRLCWVLCESLEIRIAI